MTISDSLDLDIGNKEEFIESGNKHLLPGEKTFEFGAKSATLNSLLEQAGAPSVIDFLSLDVEGAELAILRGVDFTQFKFRFILIECRDVNNLEMFLEPFGYKLQEKVSHHDYLFALVEGF